MSRNPPPPCLACHSCQLAITLSRLVANGSLAVCPRCGSQWMAPIANQGGGVFGNVFTNIRAEGCGVAISMSGAGVRHNRFDGVRIAGSGVGIRIDDSRDNAFRHVSMRDVGTGFELSGDAETVIEHLDYG